MIKDNKKIYTIISAVLCLVLGIIMVIFPEISIKAVGYLFGTVMLAYGVLNVVWYVKYRLLNLQLVSGILMILYGVLLYANPMGLVKLLLSGVGIAVLVFGIIKITRESQRSNALGLVYAITITVLGGSIILNPLFSGKVFTMIIGIILIISSVMILVNMINNKPGGDSNTIEGEFKDITNEQY